MMNWCEGLTLRSGNVACKDWQAKIDQRKITPRFIFIKEQMISTRTASSPAWNRRETLRGFQGFNIKNVSYTFSVATALRAVQGFAGSGYRICETDSRERSKNMKTKCLVFISCFAAAALIASPALGEQPHKKTMVRSSSTPQRMTSSRSTKNDTDISLRRYTLLRRHPLQLWWRI